MKIETKKRIANWLMARPKMAMVYMVVTASLYALVMGKRAFTDAHEFCKYMKGLSRNENQD